MESTLDKSSLGKIDELYEIKRDFIKSQENLVKKFESTNKKSYLFSFAARFCLIVEIFCLSFFLIAYYFDPSQFFSRKTFIISLCIVVSFLSVFLLFLAKSTLTFYKEFTDKLERNMIETIDLDFKSREIYQEISEKKININEILYDVNIILRNMTKSRFEYYFKGIFYEFFTYTTIIFLLAFFLIAKLTFLF